MGHILKIYVLKSCDTCRRALSELKAAGLTPEVRDVRADGVLAPDLDAMWRDIGDALVNRRSTTWRGLSDQEKSGDLKALLAANPTLIKRPVIQAGGIWMAGWTPEIRARHLGNDASGA